MKKSCQFMLLFLTGVILIALPVLAEESKSEKIQITSEKPELGLETLINIDADDAFLAKILSILAEISGYNIVSGPEVNNRHRISIHLKKTPIEEAVNLVVRAAGLSYEIVGNSFLVTSHKNLEKEVGISSYYVELEYAQANEVKRLLKGLTKNIEVEKGKNALLISTSPKIIGEIRTVIKKIDRPSRQVMLQTRIIEVSLDALEEIGIDWARLSHITTIIAENPVDALGAGRPPTLGDLGTMNLDELPTQHIYEKIDGLDNVGKFSRQLKAFDVTLDFLLKTNRGRILTNTKLTTLNNHTATIHIGEIIPFLVQSQQTAQVEREEIGIKLEITPQINNDGYITAHIKPEVSTIVELIDGRIPRKKIRTAETTVIVKDRQRIFIAGLTSTDEKIIIHKVPFLGDLLFLGRFFQHMEKRQIKQDLIIEITPFILNNKEGFPLLSADSLLDLRDSALIARDGFQRDSSVRAPTHLVFTPAPHVLKPFQYTIGIREISIGQFGEMQITFAPLGNYGKQIFGIKKALGSSLALGVGYNRGNTWGEEKYNLGGRVGVYLVKGLVQTGVLNINGILDMALGSYQSMGFGLAGSLNFGDLVSLMGEFTETYTPSGPGGLEIFDPWGSAAIRFRMPGTKGLSFDLGGAFSSPDRLSEQVFNFSKVDYDTYFSNFELKLYFDLAYSGVF